MKHTSLMFYISCLNAETKLVLKHSKINLPKNKYQLKRSSTLLESFFESKFSQLCINYRGLRLLNIIAIVQNIDLEQYPTLEFFKEKLKAYLLTLDDATFLF